MAKTPRIYGTGKRSALEQALDAVERLGRAAAKHAPKPEPETAKSGAGNRTGSGEGAEPPTRATMTFPPRRAANPRV